jgi:8-oxo-dGTP diphosphatase
MRKRASAIIVRDKKILLVGDSRHAHFWTPGGGVEEGESVEEAIEREVLEELGCKVVKSEFLTTYETGHQLIAGRKFKPNEIFSYLVEIEGEIVPQMEIERVLWASKEDLDNIIIPEKFRHIIVARLIENNLL